MSDEYNFLRRDIGRLNEKLHDMTEQRDYWRSQVDLVKQEQSSHPAAMAIPEDVLRTARAIGKVEWGATDAKSDEAHLSDFANTLRITRDNFEVKGDVALQGVYLQGTETVLCHTGISPNSGQHARIIVGLWNHLVDMALASVSDSNPEGRDLGLGAKPASAVGNAETPNPLPADHAELVKALRQFHENSDFGKPHLLRAATLITSQAEEIERLRAALSQKE